MAIINDWSHTLHRYVLVKKEEVIQDYNIISSIMFNMVVSTISKFGVSKTNPLVIAVDSKPYWRSEFYNNNKDKFPEYKDQTYKGNRVKDPMINWDTVNKIDKFILKTLDLCTDIKVVNVPTAEADDVIAVASKYYKSKNEPLIVITSDKDMVQCQNEKVHIFDPLKQLFVPEVNKEWFVKTHIMKGDKGDNILAIKPRLGKETAIKMYPTLTETLLTNPEMNARYEFNRTLIDFDYIPEELQTKIFAKLEEEHENYHAMNLMKCFQRIGCSELSSNHRKFKFEDREKNTELNSIMKQRNDGGAVWENLFME
jgi:5'-3' exonuclease